MLFAYISFSMFNWMMSQKFNFARKNWSITAKPHTINSVRTLTTLIIVLWKNTDINFLYANWWLRVYVCVCIIYFFRYTAIYTINTQQIHNTLNNYYHSIIIFLCSFLFVYIEKKTIFFVIKLSKYFSFFYDNFIKWWVL